ncbi:hypothetical protein [Halorussus amylolyticus]|uniref:hypothetical protein n=1 Tax=Halorussus amylolyticus TaxID=1126242 RepID=UPI00104E2C0C|nr:hypothetical protein [Halorussus amylolyticus]
MKPNYSRRVAPLVRTPRRRGGVGGRVTSTLALPITALALVVSSLLTGTAFATALAVVPTTVPTLLVGWAASIGFAFALPLAVVRGVVAVVERTE